MHTIAEISEVPLQLPLVRLNRYPIDPGTDRPPLPTKRVPKRGFVDVLSSAVNWVWCDRSAAAWTRASWAGRDPRP